MISVGDTVEVYGNHYEVLEVGETILTTGGVYYRMEATRVN